MGDSAIVTITAAIASFAFPTAVLPTLLLASASSPTSETAAASHASLLTQIVLCIVSATVMAYLAKMARQPLLLAYILAGVVIGPLVLGWVSDPQIIQTLSELGLAFLLFIVGLEIDLKKLLSSGRQAAIITLGQVIGCGLLGYLAALALGYRGLPAGYLGAAVAFSSTMIVVKLLSDRSELDTLPGRVTLGILLFQDVVAIVVLAIQPNLTGGGLSPIILGLAALRGLALVAGSILAARYLLPPLFRWCAMSPELVLLSAISWCFAVCLAAVYFEFSLAMGALIAGVSMSAFPYSLDVIAKIRSLRDFFVTLFFVSLGMLLTKPTPALLLTAGVLSIVAMLGRFLTVWPLAKTQGYDNRVGLLSSIHTSPISEFGLVIVMLGLSFKHFSLDDNIVSVVVLVLIATSTLTTYLFQFSHRLAGLVSARTSPTPDQPHDTSSPHHAGGEPVMLVGCFRAGLHLVESLAQHHIPCAVVDFNPHLPARLKHLNIRTVYGDISHLETLEHLGVDQAKVIIASISDDFLRGTNNQKLLEGLRKLNPKAIIAVYAESAAHARQLYQAGADYVVTPPLLAADELHKVVVHALAGEIHLVRSQHQEHLSQRGKLET